MAGARPRLAAPAPLSRLAVIASRPGRPGRGMPAAHLGVIRPQRAAGGSGDKSRRSDTTAAAVRPSRASNSPSDPVLNRVIGVAPVTPGAPATAAAVASWAGLDVVTRTSAPTAKAAWSCADCCQLARWVRATVPVATARMTSRTGPLWLTGRLLISQLASAAPSRLVPTVIRSTARARNGRTRSVISVTAARASAGAATGTGSMPIPPAAVWATAEYVRSSRIATSARASSARSPPARATDAIAACLPRRTLASPGAAGLSAVPSMIAVQSVRTASAAHHTPGGSPVTCRPAARSTGVFTSRPARRLPASAPTTAAIPPSRSASASPGDTSCQRRAPRALSRADSSSRWLASSRVGSTSAAAAKSRNCRVPMVSSDRATARLRPVPVSACGMPLLTCSPPRLAVPLRNASAWPIRVASSATPTPMRAASGTATQDTWPTVRPPRPKAAGLTTSGP